MQNTRARKVLGGAAALGLGIVALGGCELGNGSDPNCSEETIVELQDKLGWIGEQRTEQQEIIDGEDSSNAEVLAARIALDLLNKKEAATFVALDACDADDGR